MKMKWPIRRAAFDLIDLLIYEGQYELLPHYGFIKSIAIKQTGFQLSDKQMRYLGGLHARYVKDETKRDWWRDSGYGDE